MLGYKLKSVLEILPELLPLVKQASITQEYPTDNKDSCLASAMVLQHSRAEKISTPYEVIEKVAAAVEVYGLGDTVSKFSDTLELRKMGGMQKQAAMLEQGTFESRQAFFEGELCGRKDLPKLEKLAQSLFEESQARGVEPSAAVRTYSGNAYLSKQAALTALGRRFSVTKNDVFVKLAAALSREAEVLPPNRTVQSLCQTVTGMDKTAGLHDQGFDFYKETLLTKEAVLGGSNVNLCGKDYPLGDVLKLPRDQVDHYLGKDIGEGLSSDPVTAKAVVESLPNDMKHVMKSLLSNT